MNKHTLYDVPSKTNIVEDKDKIMVMLLLILFLVVLVRTAWMSDDAQITLRTVLNFIHGYGPTFNIDERVQAYTHPLWFLLISGFSFFLGNVFLVTFVLSISVSLITLWLFLTKISDHRIGAMIVAGAFILSKSYVDFSTSGLENPLSHLLILGVVLLALKSTSLTYFFVGCSLLYLNRPDLVLLILPLSCYFVIQNAHSPMQLFRSLLVGISPIIVWTLFSLFYYGYIFPNTAYAKLGTGIALHEYLMQGLTYLLHAFDTDPMAIVLIILGIIMGAYASMFGMMLSAGIFLYCLYIVCIGGDFMAGRFLTAPLFLAGIQIARYPFTKKQWTIFAIGVGILGLINIQTTLLSGSTYKAEKFHAGIADERGFYFQQFGLVNANRHTFSVPDWQVAGPIRVQVVCGRLGTHGIEDGPSIHLLDNCALADPLLAHMPSQYQSNWRIGHFYRTLPENYIESILQNKNLLTDPQIRAYYELIREITRGHLNDPQRWQDIIALNFFNPHTVYAAQ